MRRHCAGPGLAPLAEIEAYEAGSRVHDQGAQPPSPLAALPLRGDEGAHALPSYRGDLFPAGSDLPSRDNRPTDSRASLTASELPGHSATARSPGCSGAVAGASPGSTAAMPWRGWRPATLGGASPGSTAASTEPARYDDAATGSLVPAGIQIREKTPPAGALGELRC